MVIIIYDRVWCEGLNTLVGVQPFCISDNPIFSVAHCQFESINFLLKRFFWCSTYHEKDTSSTATLACSPLSSKQTLSFLFFKKPLRPPTYTIIVLLGSVSVDSL